MKHQPNIVFFIKSWLRDWPYEAAATIALAKRCQFLQGNLADGKRLIKFISLFVCEEA